MWTSFRKKHQHRRLHPEEEEVWCFDILLSIAIGAEVFAADATYCFDTGSECEQFGRRPTECERFEAPPLGCEPSGEEEVLCHLIVVRPT